PLAVRRLDGLLEEALALAVPALQAAREVPRERHLEEQEHDDGRQQRRGERAQQTLAAGGDPVEALVGLEQDGGTIGGPEHGVGLEQLALLALVAVLRG